MSRLALPALVGLITLSGCSASGPDTDDVLFETTADAYAPGDRVTVRLVNETDGALGYNLCHTAVEVRRGGAWAPASSGGGAAACLDVLLFLEAGGVADRALTLPDDLAAGPYRLVTDVELIGDGRRFEVAARFAVR